MDFLEVERLSKRYGQTSVFEDLSFVAAKGEFITLLGPSGCGKTTLLRCLAGLTANDDGKIYVDGREIGRLKCRDRGIGMVFQSYALFPNMDVVENISFGLRMQGLRKAQYLGRVRETIATVELEGKEHSYPHQLSGGQQQRVALARALVMEPKILLLDEPLNALDAKIRKSLRMEIRKIQQKLDITTIFVTHDQEEALIISDKILILESGRIVQMGRPEEIYATPRTEFVANFIGNYNVFSGTQLESISGIVRAGSLFAIRPEAINLSRERVSDNGHGIATRGLIEDRLVLGSIIRYNVRVNNFILVVDLLNREQDWFEKGQHAGLFIPWEECKQLAAN